jgi:hypothetical protein
MAGDSTDLGSLGNSVSSFIFGGNTGLSYSALKRRQAIAEAVAKQAAAQPYAQNVGQGIQAMGRALGARLQENRLATAEAEYAKRNAANVQRFLGGGGFSAPTPNQTVARPAAPTPAAPAAPPTPAATGQPNMFMGQPYKPASVVPTPDVNPNAPATGTLPGATPASDSSDMPVPDDVRARITAAIQGQKQPQQQTAPVPEVPQANPTMPGATPPVQAQSFLNSQQDEGAIPSTPQTFSGGGAADPMIEARRSAVGGIESGGRRDPYTVVGAPTNGRYPLGRYQVMSDNLPQWSQAALGRVVTPQEFLGSKEIQDAIFDHRFGGYVNRYGEEGAARAWYAGEKGMRNLGATDLHGRLTVQQYGQDYLRRLGGGQRAEGPLQTQLASLNTGTMSDALPPGAARMMPGVEQDENPPTPSDIEPAPAQVAQLGARGGLTSDMFSATPMLPGGMQRAAPNAAPSAAPAPRPDAPAAPAPGRVYVAPKPVEPEPPKIVPMTDRERGARMLLASDPENPNTKVLAEQVIAEEVEKRKYEQERNNTAYAAAVQHYQQMLTTHQTSVGTEQERQAALDKTNAEARSRETYGTVPSFMVEDLTKRRDSAQASVTALEGIQNAREAIKAGALFGPDAKAALAWHKARAWATGNEESKRIIAATESFESNMGGPVAQAIKQYAGKDVSQSELKYVRDIVGGSIGLNKDTVERMLNISAQAARGTINDHNTHVNRVLATQPSAVRETFNVSGPRAAVGVGGGVPHFATEAEANAAGLNAGTEVVINGRKGKWYPPK